MKAFFQNRAYDPESPLSASLTKNLNFVAHWHTDIEIVYVYEGSIGVGINSEYRVLTPGELSVCGSNDIHYYDSDGMASSVLLLIFHPGVLNSFLSECKSLQPGSIIMDHSCLSSGENSEELQARMKEIFDSILDETGQKQDFYPLFSSLRVVELFLILFRSFPAYYEESRKSSRAVASSSDTKPMQKALRYLEENYTHDITLEEISSEVSLSRFYFSRLFVKTTGMNFSAYLNHVRISKAEELLLKSRKPVAEVAFETGFNSIRTFNRSFKAVKGFPPQDLRHTSPISIKRAK